MAYATTYEGYAAAVTGGAGQPAVTVTNLNDSGAGSLRDAITTGNRIVEIDAALNGDIALLSELTINVDNLTIRGHNNVGIINNRVRISNADNLLIERVRFGGGTANDSIWLRSESGAARTLNVAFHHCEFTGPVPNNALNVSWMFGNDLNLTVAHCEFAGLRWGAIVDGGGTNEGGVYKSSFHNCWFDDVADRQPLLNTAPGVTSLLHCWNNVYDNYGEATGGGGGIKTAGESQTLVEYCVATPRNVGDTVGHNSQTVTTARTNFSAGNAGLAAPGGHDNQNNTLNTSNDANSTASETDTLPENVPAPTYSYTAETSPDAQTIRNEAGPGGGLAETVTGSATATITTTAAATMTGPPTPPTITPDENDNTWDAPGTAILTAASVESSPTWTWEIRVDNGAWTPIPEADGVNPLEVTVDEQSGSAQGTTVFYDVRVNDGINDWSAPEPVTFVFPATSGQPGAGHAAITTTAVATLTSSGAKTGSGTATITTTASAAFEATQTRTGSGTATIPTTASATLTKQSNNVLTGTGTAAVTTNGTAFLSVRSATVFDPTVEGCGLGTDIAITLIGKGHRYELVGGDSPYILAPKAGVRGGAAWAVESERLGFSTPGEVVTNVRATAKPITLPLVVKGATEAGLDVDLAVLSKILNPATGPCQILYRRADGTQREITATYTTGAERVLTGDMNRVRHSELTLTFRAHNPFWRQVDLTNGESLGTFNNGYFADQNQLTVTNVGDVQVWPEWRLVGPLQNIQLANVSTGQMFRVHASIATGDVIRIVTNPAERGIWLNNEVQWTVLDPTLSDLWPLLPGVNQLLFRAVYQVDEVGGTWRMRWPIFWETP